MESPDRTARDAGTGLLSPDDLDSRGGGGGQPYIQTRSRSVDEPMFLPVPAPGTWIVAVHARNPETGMIVEMPLRKPQFITGGYYMRRHDESGTWLEPLSVHGESEEVVPRG